MRPTVARPLPLLGRHLLVVVVATAAVTGAVAVHLGEAGLDADRLFDEVALGVALTAVLGLLGVPATLRRERLRRSGIEAVDAMSGEEFEQRLATLYLSSGYRVRPTGGSGDYGADLVLERDGTRTVVQAKRYEAPVGIVAVQQVIGAKRYYEADGALVVTNSSCTRAARTLAAASGVRLVERDELLALLAAQVREHRPLTGVRLLVRQVAEGAVLLGYALGCAARLVWWVARAAARAVRAAR